MTTAQELAADDAADSGYGAASGDSQSTADQVQPEHEPPTQPGVDSDNYANTDDEATRRVP